jgi:hypothetical protein
MHERISMLFFRRMGVPAPREAHTRLPSTTPTPGCSRSSNRWTGLPETRRR